MGGVPLYSDYPGAQHRSFARGYSIAFLVHGSLMEVAHLPCMGSEPAGVCVQGGLQPIPHDLLKRLLAFGQSGKARDLYDRRYKREDAELNDVPRNPLLFVPSHPSRELRKDMDAASVAYSIPGEGKVDFHAL